MYAEIKENKIISCCENPYLNYEFINIDFAQFTNDFEKYLKDGGCVLIDENKMPLLNPNFEQEQEAKEQERIARLHLTRGDVFRGLLQAKQVTREQLRALILAMPDGLAKEMALIDFDEALEFYRGNALIDTVGAQLGITVEQMNRFFETNNFEELIREEIIY